MEGFYFDPKHGGCLRRIVRVDANHLAILGVYGDDERWPGAPWHAVMWEEGAPGHWHVHFTGKVKRRKHYRAVSRGRSLHWDDGNAWQRLYVHASQLGHADATMR